MQSESLALAPQPYLLGTSSSLYLWPLSFLFPMLGRYFPKPIYSWLLLTLEKWGAWAWTSFSERPFLTSPVPITLSHIPILSFVTSLYPMYWSVYLFTELSLQWAPWKKTLLSIFIISTSLTYSIVARTKWILSKYFLRLERGFSG